MAGLERYLLPVPASEEFSKEDGPPAEIRPCAALMMTAWPGGQWPVTREPACAIVTSSQARLSIRSNLDTTYRELDLPVGKLPPTLDYSEASPVRNTIEDVADFPARRLYRQRERLRGEIIVFDFAAIALCARPVSELL